MLASNHSVVYEMLLEVSHPDKKLGFFVGAPSGAKAVARLQPLIAPEGAPTELRHLVPDSILPK